MFRPAIRSRVVVNTKTDQAFEGVLWKATRRFILLKDASLVDEAGRGTPIDGEVLVDVANIDFIVRERGG